MFFRPMLHENCPLKALLLPKISVLSSPWHTYAVYTLTFYWVVNSLSIRAAMPFIPHALAMLAELNVFT